MGYRNALKDVIKGLSYFIPILSARNLYRNARERGLSVKSSLKISLGWEALRDVGAIVLYSQDLHGFAGLVYAIGTVDAYAFQGFYDSWLEPNNEKVRRRLELVKCEAC